MNILILLAFCIGYCIIAGEHFIKVNKAATAVLTAVACWTLYIIFSPDHHHVTEQLIEQMGDFSGILFFLMAAMTIVELIDMHCGFDIITNRINVTSKRQLLWIIALLSFFLSAMLDNLTTTIVMISLLMKFTLGKEERALFIGIVVITANAGGAWSPIGDVTTTMLWIDGRITAASVIAKLIIPSLICAVVPVAIASIGIQGNLNGSRFQGTVSSNEGKLKRDRNIVFFFGIAALLFVPVFKTLTHLPPFMGMLLALGSLWLLIEVLHAKKDEEEKRPLSVAQALSKIDMPSVLFFLGILMSIAALEATDILSRLSLWLDKTIGNITIIDLSIGILSAVVDNVPLVAGAMGIYGLEKFAVDHHFWIFLSYCAGTGGSTLIIGSAAGVAAMGVANIDFVWYLRKITPLAIAGYFAGAGAYMLQRIIIP
ncbi:MAG: sodium:proton antiporter NhaD [Chitinivibrionales bacterium]|nr:sodium:proton antiporter NhaD [Chitinivibrionales bacterium]